MKNFILPLLVVLAMFQLSAQTTGKLDVSVVTSSTGGNYAPRNIIAIWVEDGSGNFVKTLLAYADKRIQHLNTWEKSTSSKNIMYNRTDAITGATQSNHGTRNCTWDGTDYNKNQVTDGKYFVCMELTDKNSTGNYSKFEFAKGADNSVAPVNVASFSSIKISWKAAETVDVKEIAFNENIQIFPNPTKNMISINGGKIIDLEILNLSGAVVHKSSDATKIDMGDFKSGIYLLRIKTKSGLVVKKLIKE